MKLIHGDCAEVLKSFPENSIDAIVTDPPAGIAFMGKEWDKDKGGRDQWIEWMSGIATECLRVLKPGGHALVWALPRTSHWTATAWEDAGFEVRDRISHCFGSGFPKSLNIGKAVDKLQGNERAKSGEYQFPDGLKRNSLNDKGTNQCNRNNGEPIPKNYIQTKGTSEWEGWGSALKPSIEDWWLLRKPLSEKTIAQNVLKWGTGGINIDESRVEIPKDDKGGFRKGDYTSNCEATSYKTREDGDPYRKDQHPQGRFPANLIHDGSDEVLALFPETHSRGNYKVKHQWKSSEKGWQGPPTATNSEAGSEQFEYDNGGNASRFFKYCPPDEPEPKRLIYCAKASKRDRDEGLGVANGKRTNGHPTVKATALMRYLCRLITPPGGVILDPFMGSGSTGKAAMLEGFDFIGIEIDPEYFDIAKKRIEEHNQPFQRASR